MEAFCKNKVREEKMRAQCFVDFFHQDFPHLEKIMSPDEYHFWINNATKPDARLSYFSLLWIFNNYINDENKKQQYIKKYKDF